MPHRLSLLLGCICLILIGCDKRSVEEKSVEPITVTVSTPVTREVTEYAEYVGRTEAVNSVEIKARVTGYLEQTPFKEGTEVQKGAELCLIDPRPYQAQLDAAKGELQAYEAKYQLAKTENERVKSLYKENPKAVSLKSLDQHQAEEDAAAAAVVASKSSLEVYQLNLDFTKIVSPIEGRVGRFLVTVGNLVTENTTTLTTVVSQDPIYVYFNVDEPTIRAALRKLIGGKLPPLGSRKIQVGMEMPDESGFPRNGTVDFANNTIDPLTGTITLRASFENPASSNGVRMMLPGMFVRIRLPLGQPKKSVLISEEAIGTDQGQKYVYVVDDNNKVQYRNITLGQPQDDGLQVISTGLKADERVIISGIQMVRPEQIVKVEEQPMPSITVSPAKTVPANTVALPATAAAVTPNDSNMTPRVSPDSQDGSNSSNTPVTANSGASDASIKE